MPIFGECSVRIRVRERVFGSVSGHHHLVIENQSLTLTLGGINSQGRALSGTPSGMVLRPATLYLGIPPHLTRRSVRFQRVSVKK
jgi:hypothetical protein